MTTGPVTSRLGLTIVSLGYGTFVPVPVSAWPRGAGRDCSLGPDNRGPGRCALSWGLRAVAD
ncbi:hypothetical protein ACFOLD_11345 [Kocuria carniphila]|uniref:hypothetical protein n=1 Tax=Kocuria carniphila TaxID=262208 RepID=UPI00360D44C4